MRKFRTKKMDFRNLVHICALFCCYLENALQVAPQNQHGKGKSPFSIEHASSDGEISIATLLFRGVNDLPFFLKCSGG